jgi:hypothetical protein
MTSHRCGLPTPERKNKIVKPLCRVERDGIGGAARCRWTTCKQKHADRQQIGEIPGLHGFALPAGGRCRLGVLFDACKPHRAQRNQEPIAYFRLISVIDDDRRPVVGFVSAGLGRRINISRSPLDSRLRKKIVRRNGCLFWSMCANSSTSRALHSSWTEASRGDCISPEHFIIQ